MDDDARRSIIQSARDMLVARGGDGDAVAVEGRDLVVTSPAGRRTAPLGELADGWHVLPPNDRARRLAALVETVALPGRQVVALAASGHQRLIVGWAIAATLAMFAVASVAWARGESLAAAERRRSRAALTAAEPDSSAVAAKRHQAVCTGVRKRVVGGAAFGPYESEGWMVEIWLGREDGALTPAHSQLAPLAAAKRVPAELDAGLAAVAGELTVVDLPPPPGGGETSRPGGAVIQLQGAYAAAYLDPVQRSRFLALADRLYDSTSADLGAMWGRCGELPWHDLGAWYRGSDRGGAAGAMLFMAGRYSDSGAVPASSRDGSANTLGAFVTRARSGADDRAVGIAIQDVGGKVVGTKVGSTTITFPLGGYTLATRASRELVAILDR